MGGFKLPLGWLYFPVQVALSGWNLQQKLTQLTFNHKLQINEPQVQFQCLKTLLHL